ncbi:MAG: radical SAM protein, partial [Myxococcota bacterium]|nr:radical SAM protein [Myxococcota bacterium]
MRTAVLDGLLDRVELRRAPGRPDQVHLSVTDRCFLPCTHCDIWKNRDPDLPGAVWFDLIDRLGDWCAPASMNFVGGEPLLRRDLEELLGHARDRGFRTSFNTNGWLIDEARARTVASSGVGTVYVSLDGIHAETVDATRGREGSHARAVRAIELLDAQVGPQVVVACIIHGRNAREIPELLAWVRARGLQLVMQPLYQNFGENTYAKDWWRTSPLFPRTQGELAAIDQALDALSVERMRGGAI